MKGLYRIVPLSAILVASLALLVYQADAFTQGKKVSQSGNIHNLSAANASNPYRAVDDAVNNPRGQQICIFCHTPHSAYVEEQAPLWSRKLSVETFQRYTSTTLHLRHIANAQYGEGAQPNGSSKLCLSCHDGSSSLGGLTYGDQIAMVKDVIDNLHLASFNPSTNKMKSGHHPVSFVYLTGFSYSSQPQTGTIHPELVATGSYRFLPLSSAGRVKLFDTKKNGYGWMQCTTCHDPHQNQSDEDACYVNGGSTPVACDATNFRKIAPFWTYHGTNTTATQDTGTVCKVCHTFGTPGGYSPWIP